MYPLATNRALYLSIDPSALYFTVYTHLQPTGFFPSGNFTNSQVLFFSNASISIFIACFHFSLDKASDKVVGIEIVFRLTRNALCFGENFSNDKKCASGYKGCFVHFLVPFLIAIGSS